MTTCQECSSEISEIEAFCPFCGIKIEHAAPVAVVDEAFDSTIVITPSEVAIMKQAALDENPGAESTPQAEVIRPSGPSFFDEPKPVRPANRTAPTLEEVPVPSILSSGFARPTDPNLPVGEIKAAASSAAVLEQEPSTVETPPVAAEEEVVEFPEPEAVPESVETAVAQPMTQPETEVDSIAEPEVPKYEEPLTPVEMAEAEEPVQDISEEPLPLSEPESVEVAADSEPIPDPVPEAAADVAPARISKPLDEFDVPTPPPSMFDSVRIMEGSDPAGSGADNIDTIIGVPVASVAPAPAPEAPPAEPYPAPAMPISTDSGLGSTDSDGRKSNKLKPLPEGAILNNRYEVVRKIGGGGMVAVYLASDNNLGGVLRAVKEMVQAHIEDDQQEKAVNDFKRESMILSTLDHPSIPTIYDYFYEGEESRFYLVMKYISGGDLASKLRSVPDGKVDELVVTEWAIQLTDVLNYLHNQPSTIVYRDLKPSNIMLDGTSGRVMLVDFGIARSISQKEEKGVTAVGTMGYAPPELFSGNVEPRSDIYSLGSTMFHLLTGADPQSNPLLIFDFQKNPRPRQINSRLSDQMERILMRMVEYNADQRFSSAAELKAVLEDHLGNVRSGNLTFGVTEAPVSVSLANQSVFCGFCGQRIVATDLFCAFCGAKQPIAQQGVHSEIYQKTAMTARLVIEGTSELSAPIYSLQKDESLIGRRDPMSNIFPEVDLSKYDPQTKISRRHAKIWRDGTAFMIEDLGSSNGTVVVGPAANDLKLPSHQPYKLSNGDRIKIGDTKLHFVVG